MIKHHQTLSGKMLPAHARQFTVLLCVLLLAGCSSRGVFDTGDHAPPGMVDISGVKDAVPRHEPLSRYGNPASYVVYGKRYYTMPTSSGYRERGIASWYGTKFHGKRTSSGETYDMYQMTAAHKTLPLPSFVEVKNLRNGRIIVVKVNDRGPFVHDRIIDLSYVAAAKLGIQEHGTGLVEVRTIETETPQQRARVKPARQTVPPPGTPDRLTQAGRLVSTAAVTQPAAAAAATQAVPDNQTAQTVAVIPAVQISRPTGTAAVTQPAAATAVTQAVPDNPPAQTAAVTPTVQTSRPQSRQVPGTNVFLQVGAYRVFKNAEHMALKVERHYTGSIQIAEVNDHKGTVYKVQVGPLGNAAEAKRVARDLMPHGIKDSHAVTR